LLDWIARGRLGRNGGLGRRHWRAGRVQWLVPGRVSSVIGLLGVPPQQNTNHDRQDDKNQQAEYQRKRPRGHLAAAVTVTV